MSEIRFFDGGSVIHALLPDGSRQVFDKPESTLKSLEFDWHKLGTKAEYSKALAARDRSARLEAALSSLRSERQERRERIEAEYADRPKLLRAALRLAASEGRI